MSPNDGSEVPRLVDGELLSRIGIFNEDNQQHQLMERVAYLKDFIVAEKARIEKQQEISATKGVVIDGTSEGD